MAQNIENPGGAAVDISTPEAVMRRSINVEAILQQYWALVVGVVFFLAVTFVLLTGTLAANGGNFSYNIDDAYIHMSISKNIAEHGVWGATPYSFSSTSSSPIWTLMLSAVYFVFGVSDTAPFVMNVLLGVAALGAMFYVLRRFAMPNWMVALALAGAIWLMPLPILVFTGMEHVLQTSANLIFIYAAAAVLTQDKDGFALRSRWSYVLLLSGMLSTGTRYEGLFLVAVASGLFVLRGRLIYALILGAVSASPVVLFGLFSMANGWHFLPNSLLLKGQTPTFESFETFQRFVGLYPVMRSVAGNMHMSTLLYGTIAVLVIAILKHKTLWERSVLMVLMYLGLMVLHLQFADLGWFYRYEAYLLGIGVVIMVIALRGYFPGGDEFQLRKVEPMLRTAGALGVLVLTLGFLLPRANSAFDRQVLATNNIYNHQYQMGLFLQQFYEGEMIAMNDIGAPNYLADIRLLDLWGLASLEVIDERRVNDYTTEDIDRLVTENDIDVAMVHALAYDQFGGLPDSWIRVGQWGVEENTIIGGRGVLSFYATNPDAVEQLRANLREYADQMPEGTRQAGSYLR